MSEHRRDVAILSGTNDGAPEDADRPLGRAWLAGSAAAITATNAITAGGSLVLQILAARQLGLAGYGAFALCISVLTTALALFTGYVGDALTVMDRNAPLVRMALVTSAGIGLLFSFLAATAFVLVLHLGDLRVALVYGAMVLAWLVEELGRRLLIARLEYWRLVLNDATYVLVTLATVAVAMIMGVRLDLLVLLASMLVGALAAIGLALRQLPEAEYGQLQVGLRGGTTVARFAVWRSLQSTLRPTQLLGARVLVLQLASLAAVGAVESGRLVVAPMQTVLNGAADFLLSTGAEGQRSKRRLRLVNEQAAVVLVAVTMAGGLLATVLSHPLGRLMAGHSVPHLLVLGWAVYTAMWAASLPFTAELAVRKLSLPVFVARLVETVLGLGLVAGVLAVTGRGDVVPWLLAAPALVNAWYLRRLAVRSRPAVAAPATS